MNYIKSIIKIIFINLAMFIGLLLFIDFAVITAYKTYKAYKANIHTPNLGTAPSVNLPPNYKDIKWASKYFEEYKQLTMEYKSYVGWRRLPFQGQTITIDQSGNRVTPQNKKIHYNAPVAVFLGGSTMWGEGSNDKNTIPAIFAEITDGKYRVLNLGQCSYNAYQGFQTLNLNIMNGLKPSLIISYDGVNEESTLRAERKPFSHTRESQILNLTKNADSGKKLTYRNFLVGPIEIFIQKLMVKYSPPKVSSYYDLSQERFHQAAEELLQSWLSTKALADQNNAHFIAILQPNAVMGKPFIDHININERHLITLVRLYNTIIAMMQEDKYKELSKHVLIHTDVFDNKDLVYIDYCHVSPNGNRIIAERILNDLNFKN